jgi:hypothetical protein
MARQVSFASEQADIQMEFRQRSNTFTEAGKLPGRIGARTYPFAIDPALWDQNLYPPIREECKSYFGNDITWHRMRNHLLSSQICCLNFLMPFATRPRALADLLTPLYGPGLDMLPVEEKHPDRFVAFEWIGGDYLNESRNGNRRRGSNCTSADAAVKFRKHGRTHLVLIEWKYTETYRAPPNKLVESTRLRRYRELVFAPAGPVRATSEFEIQDLFWEPFYQLLRQQMLAHQVEVRSHDGCDEASVLHTAPRANKAFQRITAPVLRVRSGAATEIWASLLVDPTRFLSVATEDLFGRFDASRHSGLEDWSEYIRDRYTFILGDG